MDDLDTGIRDATETIGELGGGEGLKNMRDIHHALRNRVADTLADAVNNALGTQLCGRKDFSGKGLLSKLYDRSGTVNSTPVLVTRPEQPDLIEGLRGRLGELEQGVVVGPFRIKGVVESVLAAMKPDAKGPSLAITIEILKEAEAAAE